MHAARKATAGATMSAEFGWIVAAAQISKLVWVVVNQFQLCQAGTAVMLVLYRPDANFVNEV